MCHVTAATQSFQDVLEDDSQVCRLSGSSQVHGPLLEAKESSGLLYDLPRSLLPTIETEETSRWIAPSYMPHPSQLPCLHIIRY
ncbi:unnamed protein product [Nezara viridula]|uniref:Uncharacterized protein n=1 Tax=Nezara viridula TaxID=85310 RepID=A0A9P0HA44_NEZVI|nr:unnamed protein product [Nezara viridula]